MPSFGAELSAALGPAAKRHADQPGPILDLSLDHLYDDTTEHAQRKGRTSAPKLTHTMPAIRLVEEIVPCHWETWAEPRIFF